MFLSRIVVASLTTLCGRLARSVDAATGLSVIVFGHSENRGRRAVSPVVAVVLTVAIVVVIAGSIGAVGFGLTDELSEPAPNVAESNGELRTQDGYDGGIVRITHVAGDPVSVSNIEIIVTVDASDGTGKARIVNLPSDYGSSDGIPFTDENIEGDDILSKGSGSEDWDARVLHTDYKNTLEAGSWFEFRLKKTGIELTPGDTVTVRVVHTPSQSVIIEQELTAS